jgi:glutamate racemase
MPNKRNSAVGPIGMFDSGFGGLTVARAVIDLLPHEDVVYIGDTGRYPYGNKPAEQVREYAKELAWSLVNDYNAKLVVIACNTAASVALHELAEELPVPVLGVVEPGARALVRATQNGKVGVIGTVGTISSGAYVNAIRETKKQVALTSAACPGFVEFVERDQTTGDEILNMVKTNASTDNPVIQSLMADIKAKTDNPRYNTGYHALAALARRVSVNINKDPVFGEKLGGIFSIIFKS